MSHRSEASLSDEYGTPPELFAYLAKLYGPFDFDAAAAPWNAKAPRFCTKENSGLRAQWGRRNWCNPPYSTGMKEAFSWRGRCFVEAQKSDLACFLLPHDTADGYWRRVIECADWPRLGVEKVWSELGTVTRDHFEHLVVEKTEVYGRIRYWEPGGISRHTARHSSAIVVFAQPGVLPPLIQTSVRHLAFPQGALDR